MNKQIAVLVAAVAVIALGLLFFAFSEDPPLPKAQLPEENSLPLSYSGNTISEERDGKKVWELTAEFIEIDTKSRNTILKNIKGTFYQENGEQVTLTAPKAIYEDASKNIVISERVLAAATNGTTLAADTLLWTNKERLFSGEGSIVIKREDTVIVGDKIESDSEFVKFKVSGNAHIIKGGPNQ